MKPLAAFAVGALLALATPAAAELVRSYSRPVRWVRHTQSIDLAQLVTNACSHDSLTVTGAEVGGECAASIPTGSPDQVIAFCHVEAAAHVDLHVCNLGNPYDPPAGVYSVRVLNPP